MIKYLISKKVSGNSRLDKPVEDYRIDMIQALDNNTISYYYGERDSYRKNITPLNSDLGRRIYGQVL